ncbi:DUF2789 domain-containing protein [Ideonella sp. YS5]|uniref:DUF2789 domain-containing protein n=1 Tax=Ideonella sp. YS5 TaxID=3453714 RepID=UPI003EEAB8F5
MDQPVHSLAQLFAQLGLPDDAASIEAFVAHHAPLPGELILPDAPFWTPSQAAFLRSAWKSDADWVEMVDTLDAMLRRPPRPS